MLLAEAAQLSDEQVDELVAEVAAGLRRLEPGGVLHDFAVVVQLCNLRSVAKACRLNVPQAPREQLGALHARADGTPA